MRKIVSNLGFNVNHFSIDFAKHVCLICRAFDSFTSRLTIVIDRVHVPLCIHKFLQSRYWKCVASLMKIRSLANLRWRAVMSAHKQRVSVFLAVAFRHLVNCQSQGWISEKKKRLKRKISREKYQNEQLQTKRFHGNGAFAWVGHFKTARSLLGKLFFCSPWL